MATAPSPALTTPTATVAWPDLSAYGVHFGIVDVPNIGPRLVMVDESGSWSAMAERMDFKRTRWTGIWTKDKIALDVPGFHSLTKAKVVMKTKQQLRDDINRLLLSRQSMRMSQISRLSAAERTKTKSAGKTPGSAISREQAAIEAAREPEPIPVAVAVRQTLHLGLNRHGHEVYENSDGSRFTKAQDVVVSQEPGSGPDFLRSTNDDELVDCAAGMVKEIILGRHLRSEDFDRTLKAVFGLEYAADEAALTENSVRLNRALDVAMARYLVSETSKADAETFGIALSMHEGRPVTPRVAGSLPTPLPLAVLLQSVAASELVENGLVVDLSPAGAHSWLLPNALAIDVSRNDIVPSHQVAVGGVFSSPIEPLSIQGVRVSRADHAAILQTLAARTPVGRSAFVIAGGKSAGTLDADMRRVLSSIGAGHEILGIADLDPAMMGPGNTVPSRIVVIGNKRERIDYTFAVPSRIPVHYEYAALWNWGEMLRADLQQGQSFDASDDREDNRWQSPYIPASQASEPEAMSPRNLLGPVRMSLARIVEETGMGIDEFVADRCQYTVDNIGDYLSAEQVDAAALGIFSYERGDGFVDADMTGLGKGRVLAALARYATLRGKPVVFISERSDLFRDFYRDVYDTGSADLLANPFILNSDIVLRDSDGKEIGRTPPRELLLETMQSGKFPANAKIVLGTYSQFNRQAPDQSAQTRTQTAREGMAMVKNGATRAEIISFYDDQIQSLHLGHHVLTGVAKGQPLIDKLTEQSAPASGLHEDIRAGFEIHLGLLTDSDADLSKRFRKLVSNDLTAWKQYWIHCAQPFEGALLLLDESHNAAGPTSNTNTNIGFPVRHAEGVVYSSATFAKDTKNFGIYSRIFPSSVNVGSIGETLDRGGAPLQEIFSVMLAEDGRAVRREHDLSNVEFRTSIDQGRLARNESWANAMAEVLSGLGVLSGEINEVADSMNKAIQAAIKGSTGPATGTTASGQLGVQYTSFSSAFYNLSRAFMMVVNADQTADLAIKALKEGRKPIVTVENTMESVLRNIIDELDTLTVDAEPEVMEATDGMTQAADELAAEAKTPQLWALGRKATFADILRKYADRVSFGMETVMVNGASVKRRVTLASPAMQPALDAIYEILERMPSIPVSPLDIVRTRVSEAGYSIAEVSGRKLELVEDPVTGHHTIKKMGARNKHALIDQFNSGNLDSLLLSKSGSTGISLHASERFLDQSQRELIELQPAADIAQRLQFWGRVNRKGQVTNPVIHMVCSGLPGERRLMTMQNAKLRRLSANISGNSDNSALNEEVPDIINKIGNEICYRWLESNPQKAQSLGIPADELSEDALVKGGNTKFVDMLTGRIQMLSVADQRAAYDDLTTEFHAYVEQCEMEGRNPLKSGEFDVRATRGKSTLIDPARTAGKASVFDGPVIATELLYQIKRDGVPIAQMEQEAAEGRAALEAEYGPEWSTILREAVRQQTDNDLPHLVGKKFKTIEEAAASKDPNAIKNYVARADFIAEALAKLTPGSIFRISFMSQLSQAAKDESAGVNNAAALEFTDYNLVVGIDTPRDPRRVCSPSEYKLVVRSSSNTKKHKITLATLMSLGKGWALELRHGTPRYETQKDYYLKTFTEDKLIDTTQVILEGNLFRAAEMSAREKMGRAVAYSDEKGTWHHAILLPRTVDLRSVLALPVEIDDAKMLEAALTQMEEIQIADSFYDDNQNWRIGKTRSGITITAKGLFDKVHWLLQDDDLKQALTKDFNGARGARLAQADMANVTQFSEAFMSAARDAGVVVYLPHHKRAWANAYITERAQDKLDRQEALVKKAQATISAATALDRELASLGL